MWRCLEKQSQKEMKETRVMHRSKAVCAKVAVAAQVLFRHTHGSSDLLMERRKRCRRFHEAPDHDRKANLH